MRRFFNSTGVVRSALARSLRSNLAATSSTAPFFSSAFQRETSRSFSAQIPTIGGRRKLSTGPGITGKARKGVNAKEAQALNDDDEDYDDDDEDEDDDDAEFDYEGEEDNLRRAEDVKAATEGADGKPLSRKQRRILASQRYREVKEEEEEIPYFEDDETKTIVINEQTKPYSFSEFYQWLAEIGFLKMQSRMGPDGHAIQTISPHDMIGILKSFQAQLRHLGSFPMHEGPMIKMLIQDPESYHQMDLLIKKYKFQPFINLISTLDASYRKSPTKGELLLIIGLPKPRILDTVIKCEFDLVTVFDPKVIPPTQTIPEMYQFPNELNSYLHILFIFTYVKGVIARVVLGPQLMVN